MGNKLVISLAGSLVIGILVAGALVVGLFSLNRSFGEWSLTEQVIAVGLIPASAILAGVLPWWLGGFPFRQSVLLSILVHAVSIGLGLATQQPVLLLVALIVGWVVLPVMLGSDT